MVAERLAAARRGDCHELSRVLMALAKTFVNVRRLVDEASTAQCDEASVRCIG